MKSDFSDAEDPHHEGAVHVHVHPVKLYVGVFLALITLTVITVLTSYVDIDGFIRPGTAAGEDHQRQAHQERLGASRLSAYS